MNLKFNEIKEEKDEISSDFIKYEVPRELKVILHPATKSEFTLFQKQQFDHFYFENLSIYDYIDALPQKPKIFPKFHGKSEAGLLFQPLRKNMKSQISEKSQLTFKEFLSYYKTLINGLAFLQILGISASELTLESIFIADNNDLKVLYYEKTSNTQSKVLDFAKLMISIGTGEELFLERAIFNKKEYCEILDLKISDLFQNIETNTPEEKMHLNDLAHKLKKLLSYEQDEKCDFIHLFFQSLKYKSPENLKKIIFIEETHGLEISYDVLITKDTMKFELNGLNNNFKIFGVSSVPIERNWDKIDEVKLSLDEIKPIKSINLRISSINSAEFEPNTLEVLEAISNKKIFRLDDFKSLIIQATPCKSLVKESHWYKFLWHAFYKDGENPIENSGLSLVKEHLSDWGKGLNPEGINKMVAIFDKNWVKERKLERIRVVLASYYSFDQDSLKNKIFNFILNLKMKKLKTLELGFEICHLTDESIFPNFLKSLGLKLKQENKDDLGVLTIIFYAYYYQTFCLEELADIISNQNQLYSLNLFVREVSNKMGWERFLLALTPQKMAYLSTLTLGFSSWVFSSSSPYLSDQCYSQLCQKILIHASAKLQNLSLLICSQGIMEESFRVISEIIYKKCDQLLSMNFYFEAYVTDETKRELTRRLATDIQYQLASNNVEVNCWRTEIYKKK